MEKKIGEYFIDRLIGKGTFGKVYVGRHCQNEKQQVAIKCIDNSLLTDKFLSDSLKGEIIVMKKLTSPNTLKLFSCISEQNMTYMILEYCPDGDMRKYIRRNGGQLSEEESIRIMTQLMNGFRNLYELGYIHRDIKPANILLKEDVFKVADFGFTTKADLTGKHTLKECVGTPLYMAPQLLQNIPYTAKSDIWSIGMLLYEMIFGKTPWPCRDIKSFLKNIKNSPLRFSYDKAISAITKDFIKKCLVIEESKRISWDEVFKHDIFNQQNKTIIEKPLVKLDETAIMVFRKIQEIIQNHDLDISKIFINFDQDQGGDLNPKEFYKMIQIIDPRVTFTEAIDIFKQVDHNNDTKISLEELKQIFINYDFCDLNDKASQLIVDLKEVIKANNLDLQLIFKNFDKDSGGSLDLNEFGKLLRVVAPGLSDDELQDIFLSFDENKDGNIDFEEFRNKLAYGFNKQDKEYNLKQERAVKLAKELKRIIKKFNLDIVQIFENYDKSGEGKLDFLQLNKMCKVIDKNLSTDDVKYIFRLFDEQQNGEISLQNFKNVLNKI